MCGTGHGRSALWWQLQGGMQRLAPSLLVFLDSTSTVFSSTAAKNNRLKLMAYVWIKPLNWHWSLHTAHPDCCLLFVYSFFEIH